MKKLLLIPFILIATIALGQNQSIYFSVGKPSFPDVFKNEKNISFGVHYQNRFSESFAYEVNYQYAHSNNYPDFFNAEEKLNNYLLNQYNWDIVTNAAWSKIQTHTFGIKLDYLFVNNQKFLFGFNLEFGYLFSSSSRFDVIRWSNDADTGKVSSYDSKTLKGKANKFFYGLSVQFQYTLYKNFVVGIAPEYLNPFDNNMDHYEDIPVLPNHYNLCITLGKRF